MRELLASSFITAILMVMPRGAVAETLAPETSLRIAIEARHDSNVARRSASEARRLGLTQSDDRLTPTLEATIRRPFGRQSVEVNAQFGYDFYRHNHRLNRERILVDGKGTIVGGPCSMGLDVDFSRRQSDLVDLVSYKQSETASVSNTLTEQKYNGTLRCGRGYGLRPTLTIGRSTANNSNVIRRISNNHSFTYGAGLSYENPVIGTFSFIVDSTKTGYPNRTIRLGGSGFRVTRGTLTAVREIGAQLQASGSLSYIQLKPDTSNLSSFHGLGWTLALTAHPTVDLKLTASTSRNVLPSLGTDSLFQLARDYDLGVSYALGPRITAGIDGNIRNLSYRGAGTAFGPILTNSVQRSFSANVIQQLGRRLELRADAGYQTRRTNNQIYDYNNLYGGMRLSLRL